MADVVLHIPRDYNHVIQMHYGKLQASQNIINHLLERSWCINSSERHHSEILHVVKTYYIFIYVHSSVICTKQ